MANSYVQFSEMIKLENEEEKTWCKYFLQLTKIVEDECDDAGMDIEDHPRYEEYTRIQDKMNLEPDYGFEFEWDIEDEGIWLYADESGNPDQMCAFAQEFLRKFAPDKYLMFSWSFTCDRPRIGEFGGGGAFVTAEKIHFIDVASELNKLAKGLEGRNA